MSAYCCVVWETFSSDSSPSLKPLGALEMSQKPLWVGKNPLWVCVVDDIAASKDILGEIILYKPL